MLLQFRKSSLLPVEITFRDAKLAQSLFEEEKYLLFPSLVVYDTPYFFSDRLVKMIQDLERLRSRPPITFSDLRFFFKSTPVKFPFLYLFPSFFPSSLGSRTHTLEWRNEKVRRNASGEEVMVVGTLELNFNLQLVKKLAVPASARTDSRLPPLRR